MSYGNRKTEGGHKGGHSNMTHWETTHEIKVATRKARRAQGRNACRTWSKDY